MKRRQKMNRNDFPMVNGTSPGHGFPPDILREPLVPARSMSSKVAAWLLISGLLAMAGVGACTAQSYFTRHVVHQVVVETCLK